MPAARRKLQLRTEIPVSRSSLRRALTWDTLFPPTKVAREEVMGMRVFILTIALMVMTSAPLHADWDSGTSNNLLLKKDLGDDWYLASRNLLASREGTDDFFFGYLDLNLGRRLANSWSAEVGYRHARLRIGDSWRDEFRPSALVSYNARLAAWSVANRHRLEYRRFEGDTTNDRWRYRNETRLIAPIELTPLDLKPFIEEEFFYELDGSGFNGNWLTVGVRHRFDMGAIAKLGYRWQAQKFGDDWQHRHVLVTGLLFFF